MEKQFGGIFNIFDSNKDDLLLDLVSMAKSGATAIALQRRFAYVEPKKTVITQNGEQLSDLQQYVFDTYWIPMLAAINENFCIISRVAFFFKRITFEFKGKKYDETIPIALEAGSYEYTVEYDDDLNIVHNFTMLNVPKQPKNIMSIGSLLNKGMLVGQNTVISSEFGTILEDWRHMKKRKKLADDVRELMIHPRLYLEHEMNKANAAIDLQNERMEDHLLAKHNESGYIVSSSEINLKYNETQKFYIIPEGYKASSYQHIPDEALLLTDESRFNILVEKALGMPFSDFATNSSAVFNSRSQSMIDETKNALSAKLQSVSNDFANAIKFIWKQLYHAEIEIGIPFRAQVDADMIEVMHNSGIIDDSVARNQMLSIAGLQDTHARNDVEVNFNKRTKVLRDHE